MSKKQKPVTQRRRSRTLWIPWCLGCSNTPWTRPETFWIRISMLVTSGYGVAGFNDDQKAAFEGIRGLQWRHYADDVQGWMNPYTSAGNGYDHSDAFRVRETRLANAHQGAERCRFGLWRHGCQDGLGPC